MPKPYQRSTSLRRLIRKTSKGIKVVFERRKKGKAKCALCGRPLAGTSATGSKTEKRPERAFGGHLCGICLERVLLWKNWLEDGTVQPDEVPVSLRKFISAIK